MYPNVDKWLISVSNRIAVLDVVQSYDSNCCGVYSSPGVKWDEAYTSKSTAGCVKMVASMRKILY